MLAGQHRRRTRPAVITRGFRRQAQLTVAADLGNLNASTGGLVRVLSSSSYGFDDPDGITANAGLIWVASRSRMYARSRGV